MSVSGLSPTYSSLSSRRPRNRNRRLQIMLVVGLVGTFFVIVAGSAWALGQDLDSTGGEIQIESAPLLTDPLRNERSFRIFLLGDTGGVPIFETTWAQVAVKNSLERMAAEKDVQMVLNMGDNIYFTGPVDEFDYRFETRFENVYNSPHLNVPWLTIAGNHDHFGNVTAEIEYTRRSFKWYFPSLYYKKTIEFNSSSIDFVMIDTISLCGNTRDIQNAGFFDMMLAASHHPQGPINATEADVQWEWIEEQLKNSRAQYLIVGGHYPMHSVSSHGPTDCLQQTLDPLLKKYRVSAYFSGHDHSLQHFVFPASDDHNIHYIVSGAASRSDASDKNRKKYSSSNFLKKYPESRFSWSPLSQLGLRKGGFIYMEFGHENADFSFFDKDSNLQYSSSIPARTIS